MSVNVFLFDDFEFDSDKLELRRNGTAVSANAVVLRLLSMFVQKPDALISREEFGAGIWQDRTVSESTLSVAIARLRRTLGQARGGCEFVQTVYRRGYRFSCAVEKRPALLPPLAASARSERDPSPFVGRQSICEELRVALSHACAGCGGLFVLTGEAGSGKTRVAERFARDATTAGIAVAWGYHRELDDTPPLWAFAGSLRSLINQSLLVRPALRDARFAALIPELTQLLPELQPVVDVASHTDGGVDELAWRPRLFDAITRALSVIGEYTPFALIFDDLQHADVASLALLHYLLPEVVRTRMLIVTTLRNEQKAMASPALRSILAHRNCTRIALQPLTESEVASYVMGELGDGARAVFRSVNERSGGNPFFMSMLVQQLRRAYSTGDIELELPITLFGMILHRFAMDEETRELLTAAAVMGHSFNLSLLQATTGRDVRSLMAIVDAAVAHELIVVASHGEAEYVFRHELLRAALYETADPNKKRGWHLRVANALDQRSARSAPAIAEHVRAALPEGDLRKTVLQCIEAARVAAETNSFTDSARYLQCAQEAIALMDAPRPMLRLAAWKRPNPSE